MWGALLSCLMFSVAIYNPLTLGQPHWLQSIAETLQADFLLLGIRAKRGQSYSGEHFGAVQLGNLRNFVSTASADADMRKYSNRIVESTRHLGGTVGINLSHRMELREEKAEWDCGPCCPQCGCDLPCQCEPMCGSSSGGNLCSHVAAEEGAADRDCGPRCFQCGGDLPWQYELMRGSGKVGNLCSQVVAEKEAADRDCGPRCPQCGGDLPCQCELLRGSGKGGNLRSHVVAEKEVRDCAVPSAVVTCPVGA